MILNIKGIDKKYLVIAILLLIFNVTFVTSLPTMAMMSYFQFFFLIFLLLFKGTKSFLSYFVLFSATSFEVAGFVDVDLEYLYSIANLPYLGFSAYFILLIVAIYILIKNNKFRIESKIDRNYKLILFFSVYIIISGCLGALICYIFNDNDLPSEIFFKFFKQDLAVYVGTSLFIIFFVLHLIYYPELIDFLKFRIFTLLVSLIVVTVISVLFRFNGTYGSHDIILMPLTSFYSITILLFAFRKDLYSRKLAFILFLVSLFFQFTFSTALGGKSWVLLSLLLLLVMIIFYKNGNKFTLVVWIILIVSLVIVAVTSILPMLMITSDDNLITSKALEAFSLIDFTSGDYLSNIPDSPKNRIDEFVNIFIEYTNKSTFSIFGKGFGGTTRDHENLFGSFLASYYTDDEYLYNAFNFMHESINNTFLKFGFAGLFLFMMILFRILKSKDMNPFLAIGFVWLVFFYGYTNSLATFGISALLLGFSKYDENDILVE